MPLDREDTSSVQYDDSKDIDVRPAVGFEVHPLITLRLQFLTVRPSSLRRSAPLVLKHHVSSVTRSFQCISKNISQHLYITPRHPLYVTVLQESQVPSYLPDQHWALYTEASPDASNARTPTLS